MGSPGMTSPTPVAGIRKRVAALVGSVAGVKKVAVLDYGSGNLRSAERALARVGADVTVTSDAQTALDADDLGRCNGGAAPLAASQQAAK